jgi:acyl carrier protein
MREALQRYLQDNFLFEFGDEITEESDLFKSGIIDSFGYIQMIKHLEKQYSIKFSEEELLSNVLVSFTSILDCVSAKMERPCAE